MYCLETADLNVEVKARKDVAVRCPANKWWASRPRTSIASAFAGW
jgi:hypothetical protein